MCVYSNAVLKVYIWFKHSPKGTLCSPGLKAMGFTYNCVNLTHSEHQRLWCHSLASIHLWIKDRVRTTRVNIILKGICLQGKKWIIGKLLFCNFYFQVWYSFFVCTHACRHGGQRMAWVSSLIMLSLSLEHTVLIDPPVSTSPSSGLQMCTTVPSSYMDAEDLNSSPWVLSSFPKPPSLILF